MSVGHKIVARGIVLGTLPSGEGSVRVRIYTDALGLVYAFAKSGREERSKLRAHLQTGTRGFFSLVRGKDVWRLTGAAHAVNAHFALNGLPHAQEAVARVLSFVRQFVRGEGNDPYFFQTLWDFFEHMPYANESTVKDAECVAILRMLASLGYVESNALISRFLDASYGPELLHAAHDARQPLLTSIREGMSASGLS